MDAKRVERPSSSATDENIDEVKKILLANNCIRSTEVTEDLNISMQSYHSLLVRKFLARN